MSHLQRYKTELQVTRNIVVDLQTKLSQYFNDMGKPDPRDIERFVENLHMVAKHISALEAFIQELETKTGTIMELVTILCLNPLPFFTLIQVLAADYE